jgi:UTP--glucose-1-phosphate uridylyltransferase
LTEVYEEHGGSILTCVKATKDSDYSKYGFIGGQQLSDSLIDVDKIIEKPGSKETSPSDFASVSGYLFEPVLFDYLNKAKEAYDGESEFIFQPSLQRMMEDGHKVYGCNIMNGKFYDTGDKLEYLKTVVDFALVHEDLKDDFKDFLRTKI